MELLGTNDLELIWQHLENCGLKSHKTELPKDEFFNGNIHIDHIIPCSFFDLTDEKTTERMLSLPNLLNYFGQ